MPEQPTRAWHAELFLFGAESRPALLERIEAARALFESARERPLRDLARSVSDPAPCEAKRLAVVADCFDDLDKKLTHALERLRDPGCRRIRERGGVYFDDAGLGEQGGLAFLFPGEGSQHPNMLADLCLHFPQAREWFDLIDRTFRDQGRRPLPSEVVFPRGGETGTAEQLLRQMDFGTEAVFTASQAVAAVLASLELRPDAVLGHSTGEYSALLVGGALRVPDQAAFIGHIRELNCLYERERDAGNLPTAALIAIAGLSTERLAELVESRDDLFLAIDNCPNQGILCGRKEAVEAVRATVSELGAIATSLPFDRAYHTPLFVPFAEAMEEFFTGLEVGPPEVPIYSAAAAAPLPSDPDELRKLAAWQYARRVRFRETVEAMHDAGVRIFLEVGSGGTLSGFVRDTLRSRPHLALATNLPGRNGIAQLEHTLAELFAHGVRFRTDELYRRRRCRPLEERPVAGSQATRMTLPLSLPTLRLSDRNGDWPSRVHAPAEAVPLPVPAGADADTARVVEQYLATMQRFIGVQEEVLTAFLSGDAPAPGQEAVDRRPAGSGPNGDRPPEEPPQPQAQPERESAGAEAVEAALLEILSERTGYPPQMLDPNLDLEADLGIDSIKRIEALGTLQVRTGLPRDDQMEEAARLKTVVGLAAFMTADGTPAQTEAPTGDPLGGGEPAGRADRVEVPGSLPLIDSATVTGEGELVARRRFTLAEDRFLGDHALGRALSRSDEQLVGLPLMPFAISVEFVAEAALLLAPGLVVSRLEDVSAHRWIYLERDELTLVARARTVDAGDGRLTARVEVHEDGADEAARPLFEATVTCAATRPDPSPATVEPGPGDEIGLTAEWIYAEQMFNGPLWQGLSTVEVAGPGHAAGTIRGLAPDGLFGSSTGSDLRTDPVTVDAAGQLVGCWAAARLEEGFVVFPRSVRVLELFGSPLAAGDTAPCRARIQAPDPQTLDSEIEVLHDDGRVRLRLQGWEDRRFAVSRELAGFVLTPRDRFLSEPWSAPSHALDREPSWVARRVRAVDLGGGGSAFWQLALAFLILNRRERETWLGLGGGERRRLEWLLGRIAAKDAVRLFLARRHGLEIGPADVEIRPDDDGRPMPVGAWVGANVRPPALSITHADEVAVAVCADVDHHAGVGVDIESRRRNGDDLIRGAFSPEEAAGLGVLSGAGAGDWALRLWSAKEAAGKALGRGLAGGPRAVRVDAVDAASGVAKLICDGDRRLLADTWVEDGFVGAVSRLEP